MINTENQKYFKTFYYSYYYIKYVLDFPFKYFKIKYRIKFSNDHYFIFQNISASLDSVYPCEDYEHNDVDDNCALMYLNEANLLQNIRIRYKKDTIYVKFKNNCTF